MHESSDGAFQQSRALAHKAEDLVRAVFERAGWKVKRPEHSQPEVDLLLDRHGVSYAVEVKAVREARSDRLIQLWSSAWLQAQRGAGHRKPLAIVIAPKIPVRAAENVLRFVKRYVPDAAAAVMDFNGLRLFHDPDLEELNFSESESHSVGLPDQHYVPNLFSDLNQWMLKVLLAPEFPEELLAAPRKKCRNALQLAQVAQVSSMSAHRLVKALQREGYLHESSRWLELVRREDLLRSWESSGSHAREVPMRFLLRGNPRVELKRVLEDQKACLALFAAAEALRLGHVAGVPPHVYVRRLDLKELAWPNVHRAGDGEPPDFIARQAMAPQSVFRGAVLVEGILVSDILQVWLDSASHPARGKEQADLIWRRLLMPLIVGKAADG